MCMGAFINHVDMAGELRGAGLSNVHITTKSIKIKLSTKGRGGVKNVQNSVHMVYE